MEAIKEAEEILASPRARGMSINQRTQLQGRTDEQKCREHKEESNRQIIQEITAAGHGHRRINKFVEANRRTERARVKELDKVRKIPEDLRTKPQARRMTTCQREQLQEIRDSQKKGKNQDRKAPKKDQGQEKHQT